MDNERDTDRLQHLYLTGVRPNGNDIGIGAYGRVFEVEFCGKSYAAKEIATFNFDRGSGERRI